MFCTSELCRVITLSSTPSSPTLFSSCTTSACFDHLQSLPFTETIKSPSFSPASCRGQAKACVAEQGPVVSQHCYGRTKCQKPGLHSPELSKAGCQGSVRVRRTHRLVYSPGRDTTLALIETQCSVMDLNRGAVALTPKGLDQLDPQGRFQPYSSMG